MLPFFRFFSICFSWLPSFPVLPSSLYFHFCIMPIYFLAPTQRSATWPDRVMASVWSRKNVKGDKVASYTATFAVLTRYEWFYLPFSAFMLFHTFQYLFQRLPHHLAFVNNFSFPGFIFLFVCRYQVHVFYTSRLAHNAKLSQRPLYGQLASAICYDSYGPPVLNIITLWNHLLFLSWIYPILFFWSG